MQHRHYPGQIHGCLTMGVATTERAIGEIGAALREAVGQGDARQVKLVGVKRSSRKNYEAAPWT
jgi:hypothetical protein